MDIPLPEIILLATDNKPDYKTDTGYFPAGDLPAKKLSAPAVQKIFIATW
jgi:hypothetical protein